MFADLNRLKAEPLFAKLQTDIRSGHIMPSFGRDSISFWYKGGKLFSYKGGKFYTHVKFAAVTDRSKKYVTEEQLSRMPLITDFVKAYEQVKANCALYSGEEAVGVSNLYKFGFARTDDSIVLLDVETYLSPARGDSVSDRVDLLLLNKETRSLRLYEAKHFSNKELWADAGKRPVVVNQVKRYENTVAQKSAQLLHMFVDYVDTANQLFGCQLPHPQGFEETPVGLLIFGFSADQLKGKLRELLIDDGSLDEVSYYAIGKVSGIKIGQLWNGLK